MTQMERYLAISNKITYRLYSFVANLYLSPLQCGLQTAHLVGDLSVSTQGNIAASGFYNRWADDDKVIIICGAANHQGVVDCYDQLFKLNQALPIELPVDIFYEDEMSMNEMATACGVIVPNIYFDAKFERPTNPDPILDVGDWVFTDPESGNYIKFSADSPEGQFIQHIKSYRLA